jgi:hypothetical protein
MSHDLVTVHRRSDVAVHRPGRPATARAERPRWLAVLVGTGHPTEVRHVKAEPGRALTEKQMRWHVRSCHDALHEEKRWPCCWGVGCVNDPELASYVPPEPPRPPEPVIIRRVPEGGRTVLVGEVIDSYEIRDRPPARAVIDRFGRPVDASARERPALERDARQRPATVHIPPQR